MSAAPLPEFPFISVVLPVRNEERFIASTLGMLQRQRYPADRCEFLVCDGRSADRTRAIVADIAHTDPRVKLVDNPGVRSSAGRNTGFRAGRGDVMLVIDGHVHIDNDELLRNVARCFRESGADCLGRPQPPAPTQPGTWAEAIGQVRASPLGHSGTSFIYSDWEGFVPAASMGAAYRREVFDKIGYVDESFDACEDLEFNTRLDEAGLRCFLSPTLTVYYHVRNSPLALFRQMYRYGCGRYKFIRRHPSRISIGQLLPALVVAGFVLLPVLWLLLPLLFWVDLAGALLYLAGVAAASGHLVSTHGWRHAWRYPVIFLAVHWGVGVGLWSSVLRGGHLSRPHGGEP